MDFIIISTLLLLLYVTTSTSPEVNSLKLEYIVFLKIQMYFVN